MFDPQLVYEIATMLCFFYCVVLLGCALGAALIYLAGTRR